MSTRMLYLFGFILVAGLLTFSVYLQVFQGFIPCPLCSLQRIAFGVLGILFLAGLFLYKHKLARLFIHSFGVLMSLAGILLAGRQIWLQHYPADSAECGVSLQYMMQVLPWHEVAQKVFMGTAECAERSWEFLSIDMAEWSFIWFCFFLIMMLYLLIKRSAAR